MSGAAGGEGGGAGEGGDICEGRVQAEAASVHPS